jgi:hypothetical protein
MEVQGPAGERLTALIAGHVDVVLDHQDVVRTYLNEARMLDEGHRSRVVESRDAYEMMFRSAIGEGVRSGEFSTDVDPKIAAIFVLSILNALERWYSPDGELGRDQIVEAIAGSALASLS